GQGNIQERLRSHISLHYPLQSFRKLPYNNNAQTQRASQYNISGSLQMYDILKYGTFRRFLWVFFFTIILTILYGAAHAECVPQDAVPACLSGIAASPGYTGALIQQADAPGMRRVRQGDKVEDW